MKLTRILLATMALAPFTLAFAGGNGMEDMHHGMPTATTKKSTAEPQTPVPATNTRCPVMGGKVDANSPTVTVENRQYRLCCQECGDKIKAVPEHYINRDGTLRGAWENTSYVNYHY